MQILDLNNCEDCIFANYLGGVQTGCSARNVYAALSPQRIGSDEYFTLSFPCNYKRTTDWKESSEKDREKRVKKVIEEARIKYSICMDNPDLSLIHETIPTFLQNTKGFPPTRIVVFLETMDLELVKKYPQVTFCSVALGTNKRDYTWHHYPDKIIAFMNDWTVDENFFSWLNKQVRDSGFVFNLIEGEPLIVPGDLWKKGARSVDDYVKNNREDSYAFRIEDLKGTWLKDEHIFIPSNPLDISLSP